MGGKPIRGRLKAFLQHVLLVFGSLLFTCLALEGLLALYNPFPRTERFSALADDPDLGWAHRIGGRPRRTVNPCGERFAHEVFKDPYLCRVPRFTAGTRVLFLGDSFTEAAQVSDGQAYYDTFEERMRGRCSVWAAGVGGFGTAQEYRLLEKVYDRVRPDLVVWQTTGNDVSDDVFELERASGRSSMLMTRPYYDPVRDHFVMRNPAYWPLGELSRNSRLFRFLAVSGVELDARRQWGLLDAVSNRAGGMAAERRAALVAQGLRVMRALVVKAVRTFPRSRFVVFSVDEDHDRELAAGFAEDHVPYLAGFAARLRESGRIDCRPADEHWNRRGHELAGVALAEALGGNW